MYGSPLIFPSSAEDINFTVSSSDSTTTAEGDTGAS